MVALVEGVFMKTKKYYIFFVAVFFCTIITLVSCFSSGGNLYFGYSSTEKNECRCNNKDHIPVGEKCKCGGSFCNCH